jgi:hypothetical protein
VVDLVGQGRRVREERRPRCERCGADRVIDDGANALLDPLPFEDEDHEVVAKVDRVSCQAKVGWIEGRTVGNQLARPRVRSLPQLQGDDEPLHGSIIGFRQRRRVMCGRPTRPALPRTRSLLTEEASRPGAGRSFDQRLCAGGTTPRACRNETNIGAPGDSRFDRPRRKVEAPTVQRSAA